jgi:hypothetical protein
VAGTKPAAGSPRGTLQALPMDCCRLGYSKPSGSNSSRRSGRATPESWRAAHDRFDFAPVPDQYNPAAARRRQRHRRRCPDHFRPAFPPLGDQLRHKIAGLGARGARMR